MAGSSIPSPLISAEQLEATRNLANVRIFDVRGSWGGKAEDGIDAYSTSHIPGAVFVDWMSHFLEPGVSLQLASVSSQVDATRSFKQLGISMGDTVVLYDDYHHMLAGRVWWAMRHWGFSNVKVLNGGWGHWKDKGLPESSENETATAGSFVAAQRSDLEIPLSTLVETKDSVNLIDARGREGFRGNPDDAKSGHIQGAINIPFRDVLDEQTGLFKDETSLEALFSSQLPGFRDTPIVSSCGSGYAGTVILLALGIVGIDAPLFDGSFALWKQDPNRPIAQS